MTQDTAHRQDDQTIQFPDTWAERDPDRIAYLMAGSGQQVTYRELVDSARRTARLLRDLGLAHGDQVALLCENVVGMLEAAWACQRSGLRYTAISTRLNATEAAYIATDSDAKVLLVSTGTAEVGAEVLAKTGITHAFCVDGEAPGFPSLADATRDLPSTRLADEAEGVDMLYSSGTTGAPKGVEADLPLAPLGTPPGVASLLASRWGFDSGTRYLSPAPLYHAAPLRFTMTVHRFGGTAVIMEKFDATRALELIEQHRITHTQMVPTMFVRMLKLPEEVRSAANVSTLSAVVHAAAPCPPEVKRAMIDWFGPVIEEYYSSTENNLFTAITSAEALERPGSVGRALSGTPHVLDDAGDPLPPGQSGTIWSEGGLDFRYHNDPERTREAHNDRGWTTVGDIGYLDEDGYLYLSDRRADLVLSGGVNIYPQEAENVMVLHPLVEDVAVFGVPDPELGEVVKAVVQPAAGVTPGPELEAELMAFCAERLSTYKCPRSIDFRSSLPRHATGKLYKRLLRDEYAANSPS
ncbi:AMP-binding protein [Nocardioides sp. AE5]|uniref:AMP-binding protein n=1 Tax=Nocardioides sp. AE5 TaxID=2962573 RepID=UPI0028820B0C|nr:AMP-binding protein [Nocardioides sp. AE5]MDT0203246.1 AMP-binding protein [Nocardioides sp. AE5]